MLPKLLLVTAALYNLGFAIFHCLFWRLFRWNYDFRSLTGINRRCIHILNVLMIFVLLVMAFLPLFYLEQMLGTALGRALTWCFAGFWFLRAVCQGLFFGWRHPATYTWGLLFLSGGTLCALATTLASA